MEKRKNKRSKKSKCPDETSEIVGKEKTNCIGSPEYIETKKKRKHSSLEDNDQTCSQATSHAKRLKNAVINSERFMQMQHVNKSTEITSTSEQMPTSFTKPENKKTSMSKKSKHSTSDLVTTDIETECREETNKQFEKPHAPILKETDNEDDKSCKFNLTYKYLS